MTLADTIARPLAKKFIAKHGKAMTIRDPNRTFDPATGSVSGSSSAMTVTGTPPSEYRVEDSSVRDVQSGDLATTVAATDTGLTSPPQVGFQLSFDSMVARIVAVTPIYSGTQVAAYKLQLRSAA